MQRPDSFYPLHPGQTVKYKNQGLGSMLIETCMADVMEENYSGVAANYISKTIVDAAPTGEIIALDSDRDKQNIFLQELEESVACRKNPARYKIDLTRRAMHLMPAETTLSGAYLFFPPKSKDPAYQSTDNPGENRADDHIDHHEG